MRNSANKRSRLALRSLSMRSRTFGRASEAVMASPVICSEFYNAGALSFPPSLADTKPLHVCNAATRARCHTVCLFDICLSYVSRLYIMAATCRQCRVGEETTARRRYRGGDVGFAETAVGFGFIF